MGYCRLWTSGSKGRLFFNPEEDRREILDWWRKNDVYPDRFELISDGAFVEFKKLRDEKETLELIFVAIMDRLEPGAIVGFEYRSADNSTMEAIFIGKKLYLRVPYVLNKLVVPHEYWKNKGFSELFGGA